MAAVAGSKGAIVPTGARPSFQAKLIESLIGGTQSIEDTVDKIGETSEFREVGVDTNMLCNLKCKYCYLDDRPASAGSVSPSEWFEILSGAVNKGVKLIAFIGKEPLLDEIAISTIERLNSARENGEFRLGMVTNGTLLPKRADRLIESGLDYLDVSLDGYNDDLNGWRGSDLATKVLQNVESYASRSPSHDFFIASVIHQRNVLRIPEFARLALNFGVKGFFCSPILKFTENTKIAEWSVELNRVKVLIEELAEVAKDFASSDGRQIIIDLPYRYSWRLLRDRMFDVTSIREDDRGATFVEIGGTQNFYVKLNLLSYSYWRALRITHDGTLIRNMDLAAHPQYFANEGDSGNEISEMWVEGSARNFHSRFLDEHMESLGSESLIFDRAVEEQLQFVRQGKIVSLA